MMRRATLLLLVLAALPAAAQMTIDSITPSSGKAGTSVVITGTNFFACCPFECAAPQVLFGNAPAQVVTATNTQIVVIAPNHVAGSATVTVQQISCSANGAFVFIGEVPALDSTMLAFVVLVLIALALMRLR